MQLGYSGYAHRIRVAEALRATLKSFASLFLALVLLGGSAAIGVWRSQRGAVGASESEFEDDIAPLLVRLPRPIVGPELEEDSEVESAPAPPAAPTLAAPREQLDLADDLAKVRRALKRSTRFDADTLSALATVLAAEQASPSVELTAAVQSLVDDFFEAARERITPEFLPAALQLANQLDAANAARFRQGTALLALIAAARDREEKLADADSVLAASAASTRRLDRALEAFRAVLQVEPGNARAQRGIEQIERRYLDRALALAKDGDFVRAEQAMAEAAKVREDSSQVADARLQLRTAFLQAEAGYLAEFETRISAADYAAAESTLDRLAALPIEAERVTALQSRLANARLYGGFRPGENFADAFVDESGSGPRMRVIPVGRFQMGAPESEPGRNPAEGPQRSVRIRRGFALALSEITVADFALFVQASAYQTDAERLGSSAAYQERSGRVTRTRGVSWRDNFKGDAAKDKLPVVHVSFNDASAYARWLSERTGQRYRLPTEAEFEYALRAGTTTRFWWGDDSPKDLVENVTGERDRSRSRREWNAAFAGYGDGFWGPAPVRSFKPNPFLLYDMGGNVSEWVEDCWHDSYARAPDNSSAWVNPGCTRRVIRGGSWGNPPDEQRSAYRMGVAAEVRGARVGFRVAREL